MSLSLPNRQASDADDGHETELVLLRACRYGYEYNEATGRPATGAPGDKHTGSGSEQGPAEAAAQALAMMPLVAAETSLRADVAAFRGDG